MEPPAVYAEELGRIGYGRPMWMPEQPPDASIELGDVGFIETRSGAFTRLFNVTKSPEDPLNSMGIPEGFVKLDISNSSKAEHPWFLSSGPIVSKSVKMAALQPSISGGGSVASGNISYNFQCSSNRGALLFLQDHADRLYLHPNKSIPRYIATHYKSWCDFVAEKDIELGDELEGPILIRGWIKTAGWAVAVMMAESRSHELNISGGLEGIASASLSFSFSESALAGTHRRIGPQRETDSQELTGLTSSLLHDQCIFLSYYKVKRRLFGPPKVIKAGAGPSGSPPPTHPESRIPVLGGPLTGDHKYRDPIEDVLDYILTFPDVDLAITSHGDMDYLFQHHRWPNDLQATLRRLPPRVDVIDKVGTLSITEPDVERIEDQLGALRLAAGHSTRSQTLATMAPMSDSGPLVVEVLESEYTNRPTDRRSEEDTGTGGNSSTRSDIVAHGLNDVFFLLRSAFLNGEFSGVKILEGDKAARALDILHKGLHSKTVSWIEFPYSKARKLLRRIYVDLWSACTEYPKSLWVVGVQLSSQTAVSSDAHTITYRGVYEGKAVTVKQLRNTWSQTDFRREVLILSTLDHPHIVPFVGIVAGDRNRVGIVSPWMGNGNIFQYMVRLEGGEDLAGQAFITRVNTWASRLYQIALGLSYLHREEVIHGDLRGENIMVDDGGSLHLTGFGHPPPQVEQQPRRTVLGNTSGLALPRLPTISPPGKPGDIYSFGRICVELYNKGPIDPFRIPNTRPSQEGEVMPDRLWSLVNNCREQDPLRRPTAEQIVESLAEII